MHAFIGSCVKHFSTEQKLGNFTVKYFAIDIPIQAENTTVRQWSKKLSELRKLERLERIVQTYKLEGRNYLPNWETVSVEDTSVDEKGKIKATLDSTLLGTALWDRVVLGHS